MTDWERVEKLRSKGLSWDEIAEDEKVGFSAPEGSGKPGLALKSLYFQRKSRRQRTSSSTSERKKEVSPEQAARETKKRRTKLLALVGIILVFAGLIPLGLSFVSNLVTALVPLYVLALLAVIGAALVGIMFVMAGSSATERWKVGVVTGVVAGLLLTGGLITASIIVGCPSLSSSTTGSPGPSGDTGWEKVANPVWTSGGLPVMFFLGSAACPYCSASSWAIYGAIKNFSTHVSGAFWATSNPGDVYPNTPEVDLSATVASGPYLSFDLQEGSYRLAIQVPTVGCPASAYVSAYDSGGSIPFMVIGGQYIHTTSFISPTVLSPNDQAMSPNDVNQAMQTQTGVYSTIIDAQYWLEAYMWEADTLAHVQPPPSVESNQQISSDYQALQG